MLSKEFKVKALNGLNSKAAGALVAAANQFNSQLTLKYRHEVADLKSIMNVMGLVIRNGETFIIESDGDDEATALNHLEQVVVMIHLC